jgi:allantoin racemase
VITDVCANAAREVASPSTEVVSATGTFGPQVIGSRGENALAQHVMLQLAAKHAPGCDAVVIAVSMDTGLPALRELLSIPVVGMTEAGALMACTVGAKLILMAGAVAAGWQRDLQALLPVPVVEGVRCATLMAESLCG